MTGLCMEYTRYISDIYFFPLVYTNLLLLQSICLVYEIFIVICLVYARYMASIYLVADAVEEDMTPCRQSHRKSHHRALSLLKFFLIHHPCTFYFAHVKVYCPFRHKERRKTVPFGSVQISHTVQRQGFCVVDT